MSKPSDTFERTLERAIFASRWILAPFFIGLIIAMLVLLLKFGKEMVSPEGGLRNFPEDPPRDSHRRREASLRD